MEESNKLELSNRLQELDIFREFSENNEANLLWNILDSINGFIIVVDANSKIVYVNPEYCNAFGIKREKFIGRDLSKLEPLALMHDVLKTGKPMRGTISHLHSLGIDIIADLVPLYRGDQLIGEVASFKNASEITEVYRELEHFKALTDYLRNELSSKNTLPPAFNKILGRNSGLVEVLRGTGQELPIATKIVIGASDFMVVYWYIMLVVVLGLVGGFIYFSKTAFGKDLLDRISLKLPVIGPFLKNLYQSRFAENFSTLISAGIPINEALEVVADLLGNNVYRNALLDARDRVVKGESVSHVFAQQKGIISPLFVQMTAVGEQTGRLDTSLLNVVRFYNRETSIFVDSVSSLIEPLLIIGLAVMVGGLVAAVILPIYKISTTIQQ